MERIQFRAMILYDFKCGLSDKECEERLAGAFKQEAPSLKTVQRWYHKFSDNEFELEDQPREGRPKTATNDEKVELVREFIASNPHATYEEIEEEMDIGSQAVRTILHDILRVRKVCARWVPHYLTNSEKEARVEFCHEMKRKFKNGNSDRQGNPHW